MQTHQVKNVKVNVNRAYRSQLQAAYGHRFLHQVKESHLKTHTSSLEVGSVEQSKTDDMLRPAVYTGCKINIPGGKEIDM